MIREIVKEDFEMLMELYTQLGDNVVPEKNEEEDKLWNRILEDKNYHVIVAEEALKQIEDKKYEEELRNDGYKNIIKYGISFLGKDCFIKLG